MGEGVQRVTLLLPHSSCLKTVPSRNERMVAFGDRHIFFRPNSLILASSGVMVAHFAPTWCLAIACAAWAVTVSSVWSLLVSERSYSSVLSSTCGCIIFSLMLCHSEMLRSSIPARCSQVHMYTHLPENCGHFISRHVDNFVPHGKSGGRH